MAEQIQSARVIEETADVAVSAERLVPTARWATLWLAVVLFAIGSAVFALRAINLNRSYDIFVDEITYLRISQGVANNLQIELYGQTFYLHPPVYFYIEGFYLKLMQGSADTIHSIYLTRYLNVFFASLSAVMLFLIAKRAANWKMGLVAAMLFALDPFIIRINSLSILDTSAVWWSLAGYWVISSGIDKDQKSLAAWRLVLAGVLFGLAILTKDMMAFVTVVPLIALFLLNWSLSRKASLLIASISLATYSIYPMAVALCGDWDRFVQQKLSGIARLAGLFKITGLNRGGGLFFLASKIISRLGEFGTTYCLIGLGMLAILFLVTNKSAIYRLLTVWVTCAFLLLVYSIFFGTLEEQFFYGLVVPSILAVVVALPIVVDRTRLYRPQWIRVQTYIVIVILLFFIRDSYYWAQSHFTPDNGFEQVLTYVHERISPTADIASTSETGQFLLGQHAAAPWGQWHTPAELQSTAPEYVIVSLAQMDWDYGTDAYPLQDWLQQNAIPVFTFTGRSNGQLIMYHLNQTKDSF